MPTYQESSNIQFSNRCNSHLILIKCILLSSHPNRIIPHSQQPPLLHSNTSPNFPQLNQFQELTQLSILHIPSAAILHEFQLARVSSKSRTLYEIQSTRTTSKSRIPIFAPDPKTNDITSCVLCTPTLTIRQQRRNRNTQFQRRTSQYAIRRHHLERALSHFPLPH